jgi:transcriptional regulator with XRE-family HTH domain
MRYNTYFNIMTDLSYKNWNSMSDKALASQIGFFVKHNRLQQNISQESLASAAGLSRSTLSLLERGDAVTLSTLIQVLRVLDRLDLMENFLIDQTISPLEMVKIEKKRRKRAGRKK